jgi:hypothetical protein
MHQDHDPMPHNNADLNEHTTRLSEFLSGVEDVISQPGFHEQFPAPINTQQFGNA